MSQTAAQFLPLVALIAIMYFLMIRPQRKKDKQINEMRKSLMVGDEIVTIGGIYGKIVKTKDETIVIQTGADRVRLGICGQMQTGQVIWWPEGFVRPLASYLDCRIYIRRPNRSEGIRNLKFAVRPGAGDGRDLQRHRGGQRPDSHDSVADTVCGCCLRKRSAGS